MWCSMVGRLAVEATAGPKCWAMSGLNSHTHEEQRSRVFLAALNMLQYFLLYFYFQHQWKGRASHRTTYACTAVVDADLHRCTARTHTIVGSCSAN